MNKERMLDLIKVLEHESDDIVFDMGRWSNECMTAGCMVGTYCIKRPAIDLKLESVTSRYMVDPDNRRTLVYTNRNNIKFSGFQAVEEYFDLERDHARELFLDANYPEQPTKQMCIDKVKKFMENYDEC